MSRNINGINSSSRSQGSRNYNSGNSGERRIPRNFDRTSEKALEMQRKALQNKFELRLRVSKLRNDIKVGELKDFFHPFGKLHRIEVIREDNNEEVTQEKEKFAHAFVMFRPTPFRPLWIKPVMERTLKGNKIELDVEEATVGSMIEGNQSNEARPYVKPKLLHLGVMLTEHTFYSEWSTQEDVKFELDIRDHRLEIKIFFNTRVVNPEDGSEIINKYRLETLFKNVEGAINVEQHPSLPGHVLTMQLKHPPRFWVRTVNTGDDIWEQETWERATLIRKPEKYIKPEEVKIDKTPLTPQVSEDMIDVGKWLAYQIHIIPKGRDDADNFHRLVEKAADYNLISRRANGHLTNSGQKIEIYSGEKLLKRDPGNFNLDFDVLYHLQCLITHNFLLEYNLSDEFYARLASIPKTKAVHILEMFLSKKRRIYKPLEQLEQSAARLTDNLLGDKVIPPYCVMIRKIIVTPTSIYVLPATIETSNRVIRHFKKQEHRFLRVAFTDEAFQKVGASYIDGDNKFNNLYNRIYRTVRYGIKIGTKTYEFLAFSASQLRENSCWYFARSTSIKAENIREWMGDFSTIKTVAKNAARMGQCFSSTRQINTVIHSSDIIHIEDIGDNGSLFSDGVGKIGPKLAVQARDVLKLKTTPSAFQFRLGGAKGVLQVCPSILDNQIQLRPSQRKFESGHLGLEIIRASCFIPSYLNRQVILILSCLGINDKVFIDMKDTMIKTLDDMLLSESDAIKVLRENADEYNTSSSMIELVKAGFMAKNRSDPYLMNLIHLFRASMLKQLKKKTKIFVPKGAFLLGVVDYTLTLRENEIFVQISDPENPNKRKIITGKVIVYRNPCLHPGDVRIVEAVKCEELKHMMDVVVFSGNGERSVPSMCAGGDLDGDDFTVIWDQDLIPPKQVRPMDYKGPEPLKVDKVKLIDIQRFFIQFILKDNVGIICHSHMALCDQSPEGANDGRCRKLAELNSDAVDFPKTGIPAQILPDLQAREFPDFMEKKNRRTYESKKVLGIIYRSIDKSRYKNYTSGFQHTIRFDHRLDADAEYRELYIKEARSLKVHYDREIRSLMNQYGIQSEYEIVSGYIIKYLKISNKKSDFELHKQVMTVSTSLRKHYRSIFENEFTHGHSSSLLPYPEMRKQKQSKAGTWYYVTYHPDEIRRQLEQGYDPGYSFPWIVSDILAELASSRNNTDLDYVEDSFDFEAEKEKHPPKIVSYTPSNELSFLADTITDDVYNATLVDLVSDDDAHSSASSSNSLKDSSNPPKLLPLTGSSIPLKPLKLELSSSGKRGEDLNMKTEKLRARFLSLETKALAAVAAAAETSSASSSKTTSVSLRSLGDSHLSPPALEESSKKLTSEVACKNVIEGIGQFDDVKRALGM